MVKTALVRPLLPSAIDMSAMVRETACTLATLVAELLPRKLSASARVMRARLMAVPRLAGVPTTVISALDFAPMVPRLQVILEPELLHVPCEDATETRVIPPERTSSNVTPVARDGPVLVTRIDQVILSPGATGLGAPVTYTPRSSRSSTAKGLPEPTWPLPSSASSSTLVPGVCTVMLPCQTPLLKLSEFVGASATVPKFPTV